MYKRGAALSILRNLIQSNFVLKMLRYLTCRFNWYLKNPIVKSLRTISVPWNEFSYINFCIPNGLKRNFVQQAYITTSCTLLLNLIKRLSSICHNKSKERICAPFFCCVIHFHQKNIQVCVLFNSQFKSMIIFFFAHLFHDFNTLCKFFFWQFASFCYFLKLFSPYI